MKYSILTLILLMFIGANAFGQIEFPNCLILVNGKLEKCCETPKHGDTLIISDTSIHFIKVGEWVIKAKYNGKLVITSSKRHSFPISWNSEPDKPSHSDTVKWTPTYWFKGQDGEWHEVKDIEKVHKNAGKIRKDSVNIMGISGWTLVKNVDSVVGHIIQVKQVDSVKEEFDTIYDQTTGDSIVLYYRTVNDGTRWMRVYKRMPNSHWLINRAMIWAITLLWLCLGAGIGFAIVKINRRK